MIKTKIEKGKWELYILKKLYDIYRGTLRLCPELSIGGTRMIDEKATYEKFGYYSTDLKPKSSKRIIAVCDGCGKVRLIQKSAYRKLCHKCATAFAAKKRIGKNHSRWNRVEKTCKVCGKTFYIAPSEIKKGGGKYCSMSCRKRGMFGENSSNWRGGNVETKCEICGKIFNVKRYLVKVGIGKYCSRECGGIAHSENYRGDKAFQWKGGISYAPYCSKFNFKFKEYIRNKFERKCFLCDKTEEENGRKLDVHHVNQNKDCGCQTEEEDNKCQFVPLCKSCHAKLHSKKHAHEIEITQKLKATLNGWYI